MKKYLLLLLIVCLFVTGCNKENKDIRKVVLEKESEYTTYKNEIISYEAPTKWEKYQIKLSQGGSNTQILDPNTINDVVVSMIEIRVSEENDYLTANDAYNELYASGNYIEDFTIRKDSVTVDELTLDYVEEYNTQKNSVSRTYYGITEDGKHFYIKFVCKATDNKLDFTVFGEKIDHLIKSIKYIKS
ncbi:MAG: hypothetical protein GX951_04920 [Mollicutes bacterium]|nr:hypothetical protein [Mollicutes bacterium]